MRSIPRPQVDLRSREAGATFDAVLADGYIITGTAPIGPS